MASGSSAGNGGGANAALQLDPIKEVMIDGFSGALGGVVGQLIFYPLENFRTRLQAATEGATYG